MNGEATTTKTYSDLGRGGATVLVSITGQKWKNVLAARRDMDARLEASLETGRFDVREQTVWGLLLGLLAENETLNENLTAVQERSGRLLQYARDARKKIVALGGEDPGSPSDP